MAEESEKITEPRAKKVKQAIFSCIGRSEAGDPCQRDTHKGICDIRGRCSKRVREALEDLYPKTLSPDDEDLNVSVFCHVRNGSPSS